MRSTYRSAIAFSLLAPLVPLALGQFGWLTSTEQFTPKNRLSGIGIDRGEMSDAVLTRRTELMIESQTFAIMRDPEALAGAKRITSPKLTPIFRAASTRSGLPFELIRAVAYLESWGDPRAESYAGPKGIMQFSEATARSAGLKIVRTKRYKVSSERVKVKTKAGNSYRTVRKRTPYAVTVRDERLLPDRAIPAAANYLARLENKFGGRDWAVFAYHCGEGCIAEVQNIVHQSDGLDKGNVTVAKAFFSASPARNRQLYDTLHHHMERDYSPTYWFRIMRAQQLL